MIVVLGAGPAGLAAAYKLAVERRSPVTVVERQARVGGNAASFVVDGIPVDFGSHRLHPSTSPAVMADIRRLLGHDLLDRPRLGRIRLRGRWVHFPLKPVDLALHLPPAFALGVVGDLLRKPFGGAPAASSFASILERGLGRTICRDFYFPYATKIWGQDPDALDPEQARRRVGNSSIGKMIGRVLGAVPGLKKPGAGRFFYPRRGFGQISDAYASAAVSAGATLLLNTAVSRIDVERGAVQRVVVTTDGVDRVLDTTQVLSTIPLPLLTRLVHDVDRPAPLVEAAQLQQRAMVLIYLTLDADQFTEFDAHYFPETSIRISRLSEPKNYSQTKRPGRTVLCAELPCSTTDDVWTQSDAELAQLVVRDLELAGLGPVPQVLAAETVRLPHAYPLYTRGYRAAFDALDRWVSAVEGLVTFGRQGLFVHDNTHHTIAMAYALVDCLGADGRFDEGRWAEARRGFEGHVVED